MSLILLRHKFAIHLQPTDAVIHVCANIDRRVELSAMSGHQRMQSYPVIIVLSFILCSIGSSVQRVSCSCLHLGSYV